MYSNPYENVSKIFSLDDPLKNKVQEAQEKAKAKITQMFQMAPAGNRQATIFQNPVFASDNGGEAETNTDNSVEKTNNSAGKQNREYNPFLKKDGSLFNPYINYQKVLDNPNVTDKAKKYISEATGLAQTPEAPAETSGDSGSYSDQLGFISAKYESGGWNPGSISSGGGDYGGVSYGIPQFSTTTGSAASFVKWLKQKAPEIGNYFGSAQPGTSDFNNAWKQAASKYGNTFGKYQTEYAYHNMVQPLINLAKQKTGVDYSRSPALRELIYSTAIQFGGGSLGLSALGNVRAGMSEADIVNASYDKKIANYKSFFKSSSSDVQEGVKNRFKNERNDVLALLKSGNSGSKSSGGASSGTGGLKAGAKIANTNAYKNDAAPGQCVWYVRGRMKEKLGKDTGAIGNANEMWYNAPSNAKVGASADNIRPNMIASYQSGTSSAGSKYGHVIYIEDVVGDTVYYTEGGSGYHKNGTDGVVKTASKQGILNGVNNNGLRFGSGLIGLIDASRL